MDFKRKELAKNAKKNLKKHYWLLVAVCLFAAFIGSEFTETMEAFKSLGTVNNEIQGAASIEANVDTVANSSVVSSVVQAMGAVITGDDDFGRTQSDAKVSEAKDNATKVLGRTRGVFASLVNAITSGGIGFTIISHKFKKSSGAYTSYSGTYGICVYNIFYQENLSCYIKKNSA